MAGPDNLPQSRLGVPDGVDERAFFTMSDGSPTLAGHADLEAVVPNEEKPHLQELERYWVNEPFAFVVVYRHATQQESRYYLVEPTLDETEQALVDFLGDKLRLSIDYETVSADASPADRAEVVRDETIRLMHRYNLLSQEEFTPDSGVAERLKEWLVSMLRKRAARQARGEEAVDPVPVDRDPDTGERKSLTDEQVETTVYYLVRDFIRYDRIDGLKHDVNIEDISCDGYNEPVFVYHSTHGQLLTNVTFPERALDEFVIELAQRARKGISKRQPNVDATLTDGSRAQLTLGREVSDRGTNFTIRQFREVPFTPVDLVAWETYSLEQMVYLWLALESGRSLVVAGGTASGKTTTLNALSLFIPSDTKLVSIEDTRELLIPQRNWVPTTTRESFKPADSSAIDEFDLLEDALRKRPDYIIMGEVRGEEGRTLFQAMNTGHTVCTTFHANSPEEVIRRFTEDPINVARSMFSAVDIVATQTSTKVDGSRVRRATSLVEIDEYDAEADEFVVDRTYGWDSVTDEVRSYAAGTTDLMETVRLDNGWTPDEFEHEWRERETLLAYLVREEIDTYAGVAATLQAYMHSPGVIMSLVARDELAAHIDALTSMRTVDIAVDDEAEALVPRPTPDADLRERVDELLADRSDLLATYDTESNGQTARTPDIESAGDSNSPAQADGASGGNQPTGDHTGFDGRSDGTAPDSDRGERARAADTRQRTKNGNRSDTADDQSARGSDWSSGVRRVPSPEPPGDDDDSEEGDR